MQTSREWCKSTAAATPSKSYDTNWHESDIKLILIEVLRVYILQEDTNTKNKSEYTIEYYGTKSTVSQGAVSQWCNSTMKGHFVLYKSFTEEW